MAFLLKGSLQTYQWGKPGRTSKVAKLAESADNDFTVNDDVNYAELWMGTHPRGPSTISSSLQCLSHWILEHPNCLGTNVPKRFHGDGQLPFLLKVLSVNKGLSIQAHPDKKRAEDLHRTMPDKYPDDNHKPEIAVALTEFEALCGFRPKEEIVQFIRNIPELRSIVGESPTKKLECSNTEQDSISSLRDCFTKLVTCDEMLVKEKLQQLLHRLSQAKKEDQDKCLSELLSRLHSQFPGDVGCFCVYFLNHVILHPGQAIFLEANLPHAYLSGDCIECMACSDNVVRAGLTPKFKDVITLCDMLKFQCKPAEEYKFASKTHPKDPYVVIYDPPIPDFTLARIQIPSDVNDYTLFAVDSPSIVIVVEGKGNAASNALTSSFTLRKGSIIFISANETVKFTPKSDEGLLMFKAYC